MAWKSKTKRTGAYKPPVLDLPPSTSKPVQPIPAPLNPAKIKEEIMPGDLPTYKNYIEIRDYDVEGPLADKRSFLEGEQLWFWIKEDKGAWSGPANDWAHNHSKKYFRHVKNFRTVVTAGANQGMYTRFYAKKFGMVYAFEPDPLNFHCMVINNQRDNVVKIQGALGDRNGMTVVRRNGFGNTGSWTVSQSEEGHVPMFKLDTFNFQSLDLIQLDIEGFEIFAIKGAHNQIKKHRPVVIMERGNTGDITQFMSLMDYKISDQSVSDTIWVPKETIL